jgi:regulator of replication initiation timing
MMDKQAIVKDMLHNLKYDSLYADLAGYVPAIEEMMKENKELTDERRALMEENKEIKQQYISAASKLKAYKDRNKINSLALQQISILANGGKVKG